MPAAILAGNFVIVDVPGGQVTLAKDLLPGIGSGELKFAGITRCPGKRPVRHRDTRCTPVKPCSSRLTRPHRAWVAAVAGRIPMVIRYQAGEATAEEPAQPFGCPAANAIHA